MTDRHSRRIARDVHGILLFDKSAGFSSNDALQRVKRLYAARKAGHTGSLDLLATGLLPICFGEATKLSGFLLEADKRYRTRLRLGIVTTTGDAEGVVVSEQAVPVLDHTLVLAVLSRFSGPMEQIPPMHSALKQGGQRLYKLAHRGLTVARSPRPIHIHALELLDLGPASIEISVRCSKGTYIRTLAEDIGAALGCGAHVAVLRREGVGGFDIKDAIGIPALEALAVQGHAALDACLLGLDQALADAPRVALSRDAAYYLGRGQPVLVPRAPACGMVRLYDDGQRFLGVGTVMEDGRIAPKRLVRAA
ncbi:MAG: tRNA pseudouridine(55) synthase TruB [Gammaproteobacteria bacterium]